MKKLIPPILIFVFTFSLVSAISQSRTGNIVQYFGKEEATDFDTTKNEVIHVFQKGLVLKQDRYYLNSATTPKEPLIHQLLFDPNFEVFAGKREEFQEGKVYTWDNIRINEKSEFNSQDLRSGYLYLEYESDSEKEVILDASGHTMIFINGFPHEGDHYDFGYSFIPLTLNKGKNTFLLTGGRFPRMRARLLSPKIGSQILLRDMTLPDLLVEETKEYLGALRIVNTSDKALEGAKLECFIGNERQITELPSVAGKFSRKVLFHIPSGGTKEHDQKLSVRVKLISETGEELDGAQFELSAKSKFKHHKKTFISQIDGSVQYYSVAPSLDKEEKGQAMFLSVHGASVEAVNQARAYKQKDWGHLVAATNRRPYGFAWEDWGRMDAIEVLNDAKKIYEPKGNRIYLTGHSMGGHGTWYLGATYPDHWGAIAPAAGYPDLLLYRGSITRALKNMSDEDLKSFGYTRERVEKMLAGTIYENELDQKMHEMIFRAGNPSRTFTLKRNYLHFPVYVLHGEKDTVVPTFIAREAVDTLKTFHNNFTYYEYPDGTHWYGDHSVDWAPIFETFKANPIKRGVEIDTLEFYTASPGVSHKSNFVEIRQQESPFEVSSVSFIRGKTPELTTSNVHELFMDFQEMGGVPKRVLIDGHKLKVPKNTESMLLVKQEGSWLEPILKNLMEKSPERNGGFKDAFTNNFVMVYGTSGTVEENEWNYQRALFDAEKFYYRANGNVEMISDKEFRAMDYRDKNVLIYGNKNNNSVWSLLLSHSPIQVENNQVRIGERVLSGENLGLYFIYPRKDSEVASVGVVTYTGMKGAKAAYANHYLVNATTFPDFMVFTDKVLSEGIPGVISSGFFDNSWQLRDEFMVWRDE